MAALLLGVVWGGALALAVCVAGIMMLLRQRLATHAVAGEESYNFV